MTEQRRQNGEIVRPLIETPNADIINAVRNSASSDFQRRIPSATKGNIKQTLESMMDFPALRNEFCDALVNRIAGEYIQTLAWENPLAEFKKSAQNYGKTYEEAAVGLVKARVYDPNQEYLGDEIYGTYVPEVETAFHTVNREEYYPITINETQLRYAFLNENGLATLTAQIMERPRTSDNLDEYLQMVHLFTEYAMLGGYYRVHAEDVTDESISDGEAQFRARRLLRKIRQMVNTIPLKPSTRYNARHMPSVVSKNDLILFMTPEVHAALDVEALAVLFNEDYAKTNQRIIDVTAQDVGIKGFQCILTTRDFFFVWDYYYGTTSSTVNPISLASNYFLHHKEAISLSPFVPAVLFWTGEGTRDDIEIPTGHVAKKPEFQIRLQKYGNPSETPKNVTRGDMVQVVSTITLDGKPDFEPVNGKAGIIYEIASDVKSQFTRISNTGILRVGLDETVNSIEVRAKATYVNPETPEVPSVASDTMTVPVVGDGLLGFAPGFVTGLSFSPSTPPNVEVGETRQLHAFATLTDGRTPDVTNMVTWSSGDPGIARVGLTGNVEGVAPGTTTIRATVFAIDTEIQVTVSGGTRSSEPEPDAVPEMDAMPGDGE